jgi:hypothetical protein
VSGRLIGTGVLKEKELGEGVWGGGDVGSVLGVQGKEETCNAPCNRGSSRIFMSLSLSSCWGLANPLQSVGFRYRAIKACTYSISEHLSFFVIPI